LLRLLGSVRDDQTPLAWVARAWALLAECERQQGDTVAAAAHYQQALKHGVEVDRAEQRSWLLALAPLQEGHLDLEAALRTSERLLEVERQRSTSEPTPGVLRDLTITLDQVGNLRVKLGQLAAAETVFTESLEISRRLVTLRGEVPEALRDLTLTLVLLGNLHLRRGQPDEAERLFDEARPLAERLRTLTQSGVHVGPIPDIPDAP
jgi:tetratricopeptide (TPR) repeat protein